MNGRLKCSLGCGASFYNDDEKAAHERQCPRRPAASPAACARTASAGASDGRAHAAARTFD